MKKVQPIDLDAEKSVLGCVFLEPESMRTLADSISEDDFYDKSNRFIYRTMKLLHEKNVSIDSSTITSELQKQALIGEVTLEYLAEIVDYVPSAANLLAYIDLVKDASLKRVLIQTAADIQNKGYDGEISSVDYIDFAERKIFELSSKRKTTNLENISDVVTRVIETTESNMRNTNLITGLETGFIELDKYTLGFHPQELIILAARPAMGKSALAMNFAVNVAKKNEGARVAIFSLEMSNDQLVSRMISSEATVDSKKIRSGQLNQNEWRFFSLGAERLSKYAISFEDNSNVTVSDIRAKCRKLKNDEGLDLVIIDYLQLIKGENNKSSRQEEVSNISRNLKQMARELNVCVIALAQLSRDVEKRDDKKPILADLRESGSIEQDADIVMFIYREEYYKKETATSKESKLILAKNRHGNIGDISLIFEGNYSRFRSYIKEEEEDDQDDN